MTRSMTPRRPFAAKGFAARAIARSARAVLAALALHSGAAFAADCDIRLSGAEVDYGRMTRAELQVTRSAGPVSIGKRQIALNVVCRQAQPFELQFDGLAASAEAYRFGKSGYFTLNLRQALVDGQPALIAQTARNGAPPGAVSDNLRLPPQASAAVVRDNRPLAGKTLTLQIEVETFVDDATTRVRDLTSLDGRGVLRLSQ